MKTPRKIWRLKEKLRLGMFCFVLDSHLKRREPVEEKKHSWGRSSVRSGILLVEIQVAVTRDTMKGLQSGSYGTLYRSRMVMKNNHRLDKRHEPEFWKHPWNWLEFTCQWEAEQSRMDTWLHPGLPVTVRETYCPTPPGLWSALYNNHKIPVDFWGPRWLGN